MIAVLDYGVGNLASIKNALDRLKTASVITNNQEKIRKADGLIMPGVGSAAEGMKNLVKNNLDKLLISEIIGGKPFLGICLGMQLLFEKSDEGKVDCLGVIKGEVRKFKKERKIPQIGWNQVGIKNKETEKLFEDIPNKSFFYFVNSYYCIPEDESIIAGETEYGEKFASVIIKGNVTATQFHPEKSGKTGQKLLSNWLKTL